jgi:dipeptidyl aminopeptidase/acylaminoacyl peptidase
MRHARTGVAVCALAAGPLLAQTGEILPNENLVVDGIPRIPAAIAEAMGRYTEFRTASLADWHPARREMLITTRFGDTNQLHLVKVPGGARKQLTFFPDRVGGGSFHPRQPFFLFTKDRGGDEFSQIYRFDLATGDVTLLTDGGRSQNGGLAWTTAGDHVSYGTTRRNGKDRDIHVMDPRDPKSDRTLLQVEGGGWGALDWSPDDKWVLVNERISANESYLWLVAAATGEKKLLTPKGGAEKVSYRGGEFARDGRAIYVTTDKDSEFHPLARIDLASGAHTFLTTHLKWDADDFELSPDGQTIAFVTNEDGVNALRLLDVATGREKPAPRLGLGVGLIGALDWHENGRDLGFTFSSARSALDVYSLDVTTGKVERWTESETGGLNTAVLPEPELIRWNSFDGRTISGFLYRPPARFAGKRPVIVNIHGGPEGQARPGFLGRSNYYLNELGVAIVYPNVRGSSGYGKTFLTLDNGARREDSVKDIGSLLDFIATRPELDSGRVMVTGGSYGGYMTLAVATHYNDRIRCALDVVGVSNFVTFLERTEAYRRDLRRVEYGDERDPQMKEFLLKIAPVNNAHKISRPLFVVQGKNDPRVPLNESEQMVATVKKNGTPVWYLMAKNEGHGFSRKRNQDFLAYATVAFMQDFLLK